MTIQALSSGLRPSRDDGVCAAGATIADVLRLLSAGATGPILMALGEGPLRTKELTQQVPGYTPRTIYRYAGRLAELEVIEREEGSGVPSKVVHRLAEPWGSELYELVNRFADASLTRLPDGRIDAQTWASLGLLADLWETGMIEQLSCGARSPTELAQGPHGLSYHQVNRRAGLFAASGLLSEVEGSAGRRRYSLTEKTRGTMGLVVGIARWRHHHVIAEDEEGMTGEEMVKALRAVLPLVKIPPHRGKGLRLDVLEAKGLAGAAAAAVWAKVEADGTVYNRAEPTPNTEGWARGKIGAWIRAVLDGNPEKVMIRGDGDLVADCLNGVHAALWSPTPSFAAQ